MSKTRRVAIAHTAVLREQKLIEVIVSVMILFDCDFSCTDPSVQDLSTVPLVYCLHMLLSVCVPIPNYRARIVVQNFLTGIRISFPFYSIVFSGIADVLHHIGVPRAQLPRAPITT